MLLTEKIKIAKAFQQSARIDTDLDIPEALNGFVFHDSAKYALERMAQMIVESNRRAFTCTGPYGAGKSSLALVLCASLTNNSISQQAKKLTKDLPYFKKAFPSDESGWLVIPLVGHRGDLVKDLGKHLFRTEEENQKRQSAKTIIKLLRKKAEERPGNGVLLVIDEMGKYLEEATQQAGDIHFFQELAESAGRTKGRLVVLGILHQSFEQYASRLGEKTRKEWVKVQGRYVDIPFVTAVEEVVDLIGKAINTDWKHPESFATAEIIANSIRNRRAGIPSDFATCLDSCWPIHPATAVLLGPLSRWRFGQNERSVFGFLGSSEPEGFQDFLKLTETMGTTYEPWRLWDYLKVNLESAIMVSADSHRWAQSVESVRLCEARGAPLHVKLAKTIAIIEMFRHGSGLMPENEVLKICVAEAKETDIGEALKDIEKWSAVIFRKHFNSWAIYAGSDFDIESSLQKELAVRKLNVEQLGDLVQMRPIIAKKHYHETGTLRWFKVEIVSAEKVCDLARNFHPTDGTAGVFFLVVPIENNYNREDVSTICKEASKPVVSDYPVAIGFSPSYERINDLGKELSALHDIKRNNPELEGDSVARREIEARITIAKEQLQTILKTSLNKTRWFVGGRRRQSRTTSSLSVFASKLADETFPYAPNIRTELINREKPSGNGQAAIRKLLYAMINHPDHKNLGIRGFPSELGIYRSVLEALDFHGKIKNDAYGFLNPLSGNKKNKRISRLWEETEKILKENQIVPISKIYEHWTLPPFGIRRGVLPILAMAFVMTNRTSVAVYNESIFQTEINSLVADLLLQKNSTIQLRWVDLGERNEKLLESLCDVANQISDNPVPQKPLEIARALVRFVFKLPTWTKRTSSISDEARDVRGVLLSASDPLQALFVDLPIIFEAHKLQGNPPQNKQSYKHFGGFIKDILKELKDAYPKMMAELRKNMLEALGQRNPNLESLHLRAKIVHGITGNFRLDAFAGRLEEFSDAQEDMESIASLAINKPVREWSDNDPKAAMLQIADFALKFRQAEMLAQLKKRNPTSEALALMLGTGENGYTMIETFDITEDEKEEVLALARDIESVLNKNGINNKQKLAALAEMLKHISIET